MPLFSELIRKNVSWEVELTTRCNSRCVGCSRQSEFHFPNPYFSENVDLDVDLLLKALAATAQVDFILFCGNYGDPLLHPEIFLILERIRESYGDLPILLHSNAAFGNEEFWQRLAKYFRSKRSYVKFSIDGLKDSHEKFRRGTRWSSTLRSAESFIGAGGRAVWKMIEFSSNREEVEAARALSEKMGFRKFELRKNNYPGLDGPISQEVDLRKPPESIVGAPLPLDLLEAWNLSQARERKFDRIQCKSLERRNLFLDAHGNVWPCCWVGGLPFRPEHELRQWFQRKVLDRFERDFNSLTRHELGEILSHPWLGGELEQSWAHDPVHFTNPLPSTCAKTCGRCS